MCSPDIPCGGILRPDEDYNAAMVQQGQRRRRATCLNGHSFRYLSRAGLGGRPRRGIEACRPCAVCHRVFEQYVIRSRHPIATCSPRCRAVKAARSLARLTIRQESLIVGRYRDGQSLDHIAEALHVGWKAARGALRRHGLAVRPPHRYAATRCLGWRCHEPIERVVNARGYAYGTRCRKHRLAEQRARRARQRAAALVKGAMDRWAQAIWSQLPRHIYLSKFMGSSDGDVIQSTPVRTLSSP